MIGKGRSGVTGSGEAERCGSPCDTTLAVDEVAALADSRINALRRCRSTEGELVVRRGATVTARSDGTTIDVVFPNVRRMKVHVA